MKKKSSFWFWISILSVVVLWGFYWGINSLISEHDLFGTTNKMPWGLLLSAYAFLVSSIGACFVGSLGSVFGIKKYEPIEKRAIFLAIVIVLTGMAVIFVELGHPFRILVRIFTSFNIRIMSPIWGMGVNYTIYLAFIILEFLFLMMKNPKMAKVVGIFAFLSAIVAHSTVGSVFGVTYVRPFWYGPYMPIDFILGAWILGFALMIVVSSFTAKSVELVSESSVKSESLVIDMGKWLAVFLSINIFFIFWKIFTGIYSGEEAKYLATLSLIKGPLSLRFWGLEIVVGLLIPLLLLIFPNTRRAGSIFTAAIFSIIGMFVNKMNLVEAGQIVPLEIFKSTEYVKYSPTFIEISIVAGAIAFVILVYSLMERFYFMKTEEV